MDIAELLDKLGRNKQLAADHYGAYKELKEEEAVLKTALLDKLQQTGLKSAKGDKFSASISTKHDFVITHEQSVIDWLKEAPNIEADAYIGLKKTEFKTLAKTLLKETGEMVDGTELITNETLTIRSNK